MCFHPSLPSHTGHLKMNNFRDVILLVQCFKYCQSSNGDIKLLCFLKVCETPQNESGAKDQTPIQKGWPNLIYLNLTFSFTNSKVHSFCFLYHHDQSGPIIVLFFGKTGSLFRLLISSVSLPFQLHMASPQKCIPVISHTLWQQWRCEIGLFSAPGEGKRSSELSLLESLWMKHSVKTNWLSLCRQLYLPPKHFQVLKSHRKIKGHQIYLEICLLAISFLLLTLERSFWVSTFLFISPWPPLFPTLCARPAHTPHPPHCAWLKWCRR